MRSRKSILAAAVSAAVLVVTAGASAHAAPAGPASVGEAIGVYAVKRYPIAPGYQVNVRSGPGTSYRIVKVLPIGSNVPVNCQKPGEWISGPYGTTNLWDNIANGQFVSDAYVNTGSDGYVAVPCS